MMDKNEIIERLERLARCAVHTVGELPFVMSLDDGIAIHEAIDMLRSQPEPHWIPCSVRLPDRFGKMLVTFIPGTLWTYVIIANYSDLMGIAKPCFWIGNVGKNDFANITSHVVAWMPLPEPYREEEQDG